MGMKKVIKEIERYADKAHSNGYDEGLYDAAAHYDEGYYSGVQDERARIVALFVMLFENELDHGTVAKAKAYKEAAEVVRIADHLEAYNEEGELID